MKQILSLLAGVLVLGLATAFGDIEYVECTHSDNSYQLYDGQVLMFYGNCEYLISQSAQGETFQVYERKVWLDEVNKISKTASIRIVLAGKVIILKVAACTDGCDHSGSNTTVSIYIDGTLVAAPCMQTGFMIMRDCSAGVNVYTVGGWRFYWNGQSYVIYAPKSVYAGTKNMTGICGDFNGNPDDDLVTREGYHIMEHTENQEHAYAVIAHSWVSNDPDSCQTEDEEEACSIDYEMVIKNKKYCGYLYPKYTDVPYLTCFKHSWKKAWYYHQLCVKSVCEAQTEIERYKAACYHLRLYYDYCAYNKIICGKWWTETFCPPTCPLENSVYRDYATPCLPTCTDPFAHKSCHEPKRPGCECKPGYLLSDGKCVQEHECGCKDPNTGYYFPLGWFEVSDDCTKKKTCKKGANDLPVLEVTDLPHCHHHAECVPFDGSRKCKCFDGYSGDGIFKCFKPSCVVYTDYTHCSTVTSVAGHDCIFDYHGPVPSNYYHVFYSIHSGTAVAKVTYNNQITELQQGEQKTIDGGYFFWEEKVLKIRSRLCLWCWKFIFGIYKDGCTAHTWKRR